MVPSLFFPALLFLIIAFAFATSATVFPFSGRVLQRNLTLSNNSTAHDYISNLFRLDEYEATARCFNPIASSYNYRICFCNTTHNAYTLSILTYDSQYSDYNKHFSRVVWSANRNRPVQEHAVLSFNPDGDLTLNDADGTLVWASGTANQSVAGILLQDNGNLIIFDQLNQTLWQSFDHPTDVLLEYQILTPGMQLISRVSEQDGSEGRYSFTAEVGGIALFDRHALGGPLPYWILGCSGRNDTFSLKHSCHNPVSFSLISGDLAFQEFFGPISYDSFSEELCHAPLACLTNYDWHVDQYLSLEQLNITFLRIEHDGFFRGYSYYGGQWLKRLDLLQNDRCLLPDACGSYGICSAFGASCNCPTMPLKDYFTELLDSSDTFSGCSPTRKLNCGNSHHHFVNLTGIDYVANTFTQPANPIDLDGCLRECSMNCSCVAAFYHTASQSCFIYAGQLRTLRMTDNLTFLAFLKVQDDVGHALNRRYMIVGISIAIVVTIIMVVVVLKCLRSYRNKDDGDDSWLTQILPALPVRYTYKELQNVTQGFGKLLGSGGSGNIYEGVLANGLRVAVKRLEADISQGKKEFHAEVAILCKIHHLNLVRLYGFCVEGSQRLLVYEYMQNGSLDRWIFSAKHEDKPSPAILSWASRFSIALGTARGLAYLHEGCQERIIHLDVKPQNILLDEKFNAKVSDFGLSSLMERGEHDITPVTTMRGTPGYLAPEWLWKGPISDKTDVYSFGLVLMEIVTGRANLGENFFGESHFLALLVEKAEEGKLVDLADKRLGDLVDETQVVRVIYTALLCIQREPSQRPSMEKVVQMLEGTIEVANLPISKILSGIQFGISLPITVDHEMKEKKSLGNDDSCHGSESSMSGWTTPDLDGSKRDSDEGGHENARMV